MIPKIIHYCWFGGNPLPSLALECIASWKKYLPDYEIRQWDESNFDVNMIPYTAEAYKQKKYAFVSDFARFWIIYHYGGLYFDTDVEVIKPLDDIIAKGNFMGFEVDPDGDNTPGKYAPRFCFAVNPGVGFGMEKEHPFIKKMINLYAGLKFELPPKNIAWYKTIVAYTTEMLCEDGLKNIKGVQVVDGINIYPHEYFSPINMISGKLHVASNTHSIHRFMGSWGLKKKSLKDIIRESLPEWIFIVNNRIKRRKYRVNE